MTVQKPRIEENWRENHGWKPPSESRKALGFELKRDKDWYTEQEFYAELRNKVLEEVAQHFDAMKSGGDTTASFAIYVRAMKT